MKHMKTSYGNGQLTFSERMNEPPVTSLVTFVKSRGAGNCTDSSKLPLIIHGGACATNLVITFCCEISSVIIRATRKPNVKYSVVSASVALRYMMYQHLRLRGDQ